MPLRDDQRIKARDSVLSRQLENEAVLLDLERGTYFGLNEVAGAIWEMIGRGATVGEIRAEVLDRYEVDPLDLERDLEQLVADLAQRGLIDVG